MFLGFHFPVKSQREKAFSRTAKFDTMGDSFLNEFFSPWNLSQMSVEQSFKRERKGENVIFFFFWNIRHFKNMWDIMKNLNIYIRKEAE